MAKRSHATDPILVLKALVQVHGDQRKTALALDVSQAYVSDLLKGRRQFSASMLVKLGLKRIVVAS